MEKTCKTCKENDCGLCDRTGRLVEDDDQCEKWTGKQTDWRTRMMQTLPLPDIKEAKWSKNCMR